MTRGRRWRRTSRGYFVPSQPGELTSAQRILDLAPLVPATGALTGWAAAHVHGVDQLDGRDPDSMDLLPITVELGRDLGRASTDRVVYRREHLPGRDRLTRHGLRVTTPLRAAFDGARLAHDLVEAVAFLDQVTHVLPVTVAELADWARPGGRWTGMISSDARWRWPIPPRPTLGVAAAHVRHAPRRPPRLQVNQPVFDLEENFLGIPDLLDPEAGLVLEFDGQDHRLRRQHRADNLREEKLEVVNLTVCRVDSLDLRQPVPLVERLRARRAQGLARDRSKDRWTLEQPLWWRRRQATGRAGSQRGGPGRLRPPYAART